MLSHLESRAWNDSTKEHSPILATVLYEDLESGLRARALMESVEANMDLPAEFRLDLWRFDWLAERSLGNIALSRADRSALVLISIGTSNPLPAAVDNWISTWVEIEQIHPLALVVLLPKEKHAATHPLHERLRDVARQKRVDFFCEFFDQSAGSRNATIPAPKTPGEILATARAFELTALGRETGHEVQVPAFSSRREAMPMVSLSPPEGPGLRGKGRPA